MMAFRGRRGLGHLAQRPPRRQTGAWLRIGRRPWSQVNVARAEALTAAGRMRSGGLAEVAAAQADGRWAAAREPQRTAGTPPDLAAALLAAPAAATAFAALGRSARYGLILPLLRASDPRARARLLSRPSTGSREVEPVLLRVLGPAGRAGIMAAVGEPVTEPEAGPRPSAKRRRVLLVAVFVVLGAIAWGVKVLMESLLAGGNVVDLVVISLRLQYNPGVAFSLGDALPTWVVLAGTAVITLVIAVYAWRVAPEIPVLGVIGLGAVVAGAVTNLINRALDGAVADYFHTGWFPTFNAPDSLITVGAALVIIAFLLPSGRTALDDGKG